MQQINGRSIYEEKKKEKAKEKGISKSFETIFHYLLTKTKTYYLLLNPIDMEMLSMMGGILCEDNNRQSIILVCMKRNFGYR